MQHAKLLTDNVTLRAKFLFVADLYNWEEFQELMLRSARLTAAPGQLCYESKKQHCSPTHHHLKGLVAKLYLKAATNNVSELNLGLPLKTVGLFKC